MQPAVQRTHLKILLLDSDSENLRRLEHRLAEEGYTVTSVDKPSRFARMFADFQPDLLILETFLPGFEEKDWISEARGLAVGRPLPILVLSVQASGESRIAAFRAGCEDYVVKPYLLEEVILRVAVLARLCFPA
jgi:two-component system response regulator PrrA